MASANDLYVNFKDLSVTLDASDPNTLVSEDHATGLSIRGGLAYLIHKLEVFFPDEQGRLAAHSGLEVGLSTRKGLVALPALGDPGTIAKCQRYFSVATSGMAYDAQPKLVSYLPPIPFAFPNITLYAQELSGTNHASLRGTDVQVRMHFTTEKMSNALLQEISEVWGWE